jgi:hypothetical protein
MWSSSIERELGISVAARAPEEKTLRSLDRIESAMALTPLLVYPAIE